MTNDIPATVCAWFEARGTVPGATLSEKLATDYFAAGLLDSLGVVELVAHLEQTYGVRFEDRHFQQRRFSTIGGLAEIVAELKTAPAP
ncbi:MAG: acyl carrier protein [Elusimicrobiota bacterium]|nr:acyl carrier protein [Elusimicrobiota bacterium]